jgi:hypothetical protein
MVDFGNDEDQVSNPEEVEYEDYSIRYESFSGYCDSSDSSVKVSTKHVKETSKNKFTISSDEYSDEEDYAYESAGSKSTNSHFSHASIHQPLKERQSESKLPKQKQSKRLRSVRSKRRIINVGVQSLEDTTSENDASKSSSSHFS